MPKIMVIDQTVKQESAHRKMDGHMDATKRIIATATRSIKIWDVQIQVDTPAEILGCLNTGIP